jgi:rhodanese-related sulfurtransferase
VKFLIDNWVLFAIALASGLLLLQPILQSGMSTGISTAEAVLMMNREKAVVIDLSESQEFDQGHPAGAHNAALKTLDTQLPSLVSNKSRPIIFFCQNGSASTKAVLIAQKLGYEQVHVLGGGLKSWREANLPLQKA